MNKEYPLFIPPPEIAVKPPRECTAKEAKDDYDWFLSVVDERIDGLLAFFDEDDSGTPYEVLIRVGRKVGEALRTPAFSEETSDGIKLTNAGYAISADIGLLVAKLILKECGDSVYWELLKKPKNHAFYNRPVLRGFGKTLLEPVRGSIAEAFGFLKGMSDSDVWWRIFENWVSKAKQARNEKS